MITVTYDYKNTTILYYQYRDDEVRSLVLPRRDEFIHVDGVTYRVGTVIHEFTRDAFIKGRSKQQIIIELSKHY